MASKRESWTVDCAVVVTPSIAAISPTTTKRMTPPRRSEADPTPDGLSEPAIRIYNGNALDVLRTLPHDIADCCAEIWDPGYGIDQSKTKRFARIANDKLPFIWFLHDALRAVKDAHRWWCRP
jgi:hypothetical protein